MMALLSGNALRDAATPLLSYIEQYWAVLTKNARHGHQDRLQDWAGLAKSSCDGHLDDLDAIKPYILFLPHDFVTPGGRFVVQFYWDSYFILLGLLDNERLDLARGMVENCFHLIEQHGLVIANRKRWAAGSQLPFLTSMVREVFAKSTDRDWLSSALTFIEQEYWGYWLNDDHRVHRGLSRYHTPSMYPAEAIAEITIDHRNGSSTQIHLRTTEVAYSAMFKRSIVSSWREWRRGSGLNRRIKDLQFLSLAQVVAQ